MRDISRADNEADALQQKIAAKQTELKQLQKAPDDSTLARQLR